MNTPQQSPKLTLTWYGHAAFKLESPSGKTILIDPWLDNPKAPAGIIETIKADLVLVTHGHSDHLGNTAEVAKRTNAKVFTMYEIYYYLKSLGVTTGTGMNKGGTIQIEGINVTMTDARHSSTISTPNGPIPGGEAAGFVVEIENGFKVYHAGDTCLFGDMKLIAQVYKPDVAIIPIGDLYTMGPKEAAVACELLSPEYIIGMHYGTFPALTGTPETLRKLLPEPLKSRVVELEIGKPFAL